MEDSQKKIVHTTSFAILAALALSHGFNDTFQSLISALFPLFRTTLDLNYIHIGMINMTFQFASSVFQPVVGWFTDRKPQPYSLPFGMTLTMIGLFCLSYAHNFWIIIISVAVIGFGSSIFHPEASRLAFLASGGRYGLAQSLFQVGGNFGSSLGPLLAAGVVHTYGQGSIIYACPVAMVSITVMLFISSWYKKNMHRLVRRKNVQDDDSSKSIGLPQLDLPRRTVIFSLVVLLILIFSKYVYLASISTYYQFYIIKKFGVSENIAPYYLFIYLFAAAVGTVLGGPIGDRIGRKYVIWFSVLGVAPFTLAMPYVDSLFWTAVLSGIIGLVLASAFSAILVYAQELMPGKVGMIAGLFFGFAFGIAGIASAVLGVLADKYGIVYVYHICSYLPLLGITTVFLPNLRKLKLK